MDEKTKQQLKVPPKSCMITVMFPIENDSEALSVKQVLDKALENFAEKRFTFQINET